MRVVDLFAGAGGFSEGARQAGARVLWAANHNQIAVDTHRANHPGTLHLCQDLHQANWALVPGHDLLLASPCCQGHSRARRDRATPAMDASRSTAWAVVSCAEYHRPKVVVVENVREFLSWGLYPAWKSAMELLGYTLTENYLNAADFGVPQARKRLFITASLRAPIPLLSPGLPHVPAETVVEWGTGVWHKIQRPGRSQATLSRIANGRKVFGQRFWMAYHGTQRGGRDLGKPFGALLTNCHIALIDGPRMRMLTVEEYRRGMGFPSGYRLPAGRIAAMHLLGNAVVPAVAKAVVAQVKAAV